MVPPLPQCRRPCKQGIAGSRTVRQRCSEGEPGRAGLARKRAKRLISIAGDGRTPPLRPIRARHAFAAPDQAVRIELLLDASAVLGIQLLRFEAHQSAQAWRARFFARAGLRVHRSAERADDRAYRGAHDSGEGDARDHRRNCQAEHCGFEREIHFASPILLDAMGRYHVSKSGRSPKTLRVYQISDAAEDCGGFFSEEKWGEAASPSVVAFAALKLCRTRFAQMVSGVAAPRVARLGEAWCGRWESNPHDVAIEGF